MNPWRFRQEFASTGENRRIPIQIIATAQNVPLPVEVFLTFLARDFRFAVIGYIRAYANYRRSRLNEQQLLEMEIFVYPTSMSNDGREMRRPSGAVKLRELNVEVFEEVLSQVQSAEEGQITDYVWKVVLNPTSVKNLLGGRGGSGPPPFLKSLGFKSTWYTHSDSEGDINCAAYALAYFKSTHGTIFRDDHPHIATKAARKLQDELGYGDIASIEDINKFVVKYPQFKVFTMAYVKFKPETSYCTEFVGRQFKDNKEPKFTCHLILYDSHWILTRSFDKFIHQATNKASRLYFCKECVCLVKSKDSSCHAIEPRPKKQKLQKYPCLAPQCKGEVHEERCPFMKCRNCQVYMKEKDHRCILLPKGFGKPAPQEEYWNGTTYNFQTEDGGDGKTTAYFAYDLETMIVKTRFNENNPRNLLTPDYDENFKYPEMDEAVFSSEYNSMVPNLVVLTNIYSSKVILFLITRFQQNKTTLALNQNLFDFMVKTV